VPGSDKVRRPSYLPLAVAAAGTVEARAATPVAAAASAPDPSRMSMRRASITSVSTMGRLSGLSEHSHRGRTVDTMDPWKKEGKEEGEGDRGNGSASDYSDRCHARHNTSFAQTLVDPL